MNSRILILITLFVSGGPVADNGTVLAKGLLTIFFVLFLFFTVEWHLASLKISVLPIFIIFTPFFLYFSGGNFSMDDFNLMMKLFLAFFLSLYVKTNLNRIVDDFLIVMYYLSVTSLFVLIIISLVPEMTISSSDWLLKKQNPTFFYLQFFQPEHKDLYRNQSIFWEPGVFSFFLNWAVYLSVIKHKERFIFKKSFWIYIIALATTFSVGGWVICSLILISTRRHFIRSKAIRITIFPLILLALMNSEFLIYLFSGRQIFSDPSFIARFTDLYYPFIVALNNPLFGFGLNEMDFYIDMARFEDVTDMIIITNSFSFIGYSLGYVVLALFIFKIYKFSRTYLNSISIFFVLLLMFSHEPLLLTVLGLLILWL